MSAQRFTDGFDLSLQLPNCNPWMSFALHQMEALRKATKYEFFAFVAPEQFGVAIPAWDTFTTQLRIPAGSWIWAYTFQSGFDPTDNVGIGDFPGVVRLTEHGTGHLLMANFVNQSIGSAAGGPFAPLGAIHSTQVLLPDPRVVIEPGIVNVEIANPSGLPIWAQLTLWCAVPEEARVYQFTECPQPPELRGTEAGGYR